jgi:hypothetical protein
VSHNQAVGDTGATFTIKNGLVLTGAAAGGGVANLGTLNATHSMFVGNMARGGSGCTNTGTTGVAGDAAGGAIASFGFNAQGGGFDVTLSVSDSQFSNNQAIGGNDNHSTLLPGHSFGGAVASHRFKKSATLKVTHCTFELNKCIGGNRNVVTPGPTDPRAVASTASSGGVCVIGTGTISDSTFDRNEVIGGQGAKGSDGGECHGGAIGIAFPKSVLTVTKCTLKGNQAIGGQAGAGGNGGDALGGGLSTDSDSTATVTNCSITHNGVTGGKGTPGGKDGENVGRGIYSLGTLVVDP